MLLTRHILFWVSCLSSSVWVFLIRFHLFLFTMLSPVSLSSIGETYHFPSISSSCCYIVRLQQCYRPSGDFSKNKKRKKRKKTALSAVLLSLYVLSLPFLSLALHSKESEVTDPLARTNYRGKRRHLTFTRANNCSNVY